MFIYLFSSKINLLIARWTSFFFLPFFVGNYPPSTSLPHLDKPNTHMHTVLIYIIFFFFCVGWIWPNCAKIRNKEMVFVSTTWKDPEVREEVLAYPLKGKWDGCLTSHLIIGNQSCKCQSQAIYYTYSTPLFLLCGAHICLIKVIDFICMKLNWYSW